MKRFEMQFPPGFQANNSVRQVIANSTSAVNQKEAGVSSNLQVNANPITDRGNNG
jgi:hypothetical protein